MQLILKKIFSLTVVLLVITGFSLYADPKVYNIGVEDIKYMPLFDSVDGKYVGVVRDILDQFAKQNGYHFEYKIRSVKRLYFEFLEKKKLDFKFPDNPNWKVEKKMNIPVIYSRPIIRYKDGIVVKPENKGLVIDKIKKIGTIKGFTPLGYEVFIQSGKIKLLEHNTVSRLLKQVLSGKLDGAYINTFVSNYCLRSAFGRPQVLLFENSLPYIESSYLLSTLEHVQIIKEFNSFLKGEKKWIELVKKKYGVVE